MSCLTNVGLHMATKHIVSRKTIGVVGTLKIVESIHIEPM